MTAAKGCTEVSISTPMNFEFKPTVKREPGHFTATTMLRRLMQAAYPDGMRVFSSGVTHLHLSSVQSKMLKLGACQDSGNMNIPPGLLQNIGNHKSFSCNMIYQVQQQKCLQVSRAALLAPVHLLGLEGSTFGVHDMDVNLRLLKHQQQEQHNAVLLMLADMNRMHGKFPPFASTPHLRARAQVGLRPAHCGSGAHAVDGHALDVLAAADANDCA